MPPLVYRRPSTPFRVAPKAPRQRVTFVPRSPSRALNQWRQQTLARRRGVSVTPVTLARPVLFTYPKTYEAQLGADMNMCPTRALTAAQLRSLGYDAGTVRQLEMFCDRSGLGLGFDGLGWNPFKAIGKAIGGAAKGIAKGVGAVAKVAKPLVRFVPGVGPIAETALDIVAPGGGGRGQPVTSPTISPVSVLPSVLKLRESILRRQGREAEAARAAQQAERVQTVVDRLEPSAPPQTTVTVSAPGAPQPQAAGMPPWLLPLAIGGIALAIVAGKKG